jgi:hypothetical protein
VKEGRRRKEGEGRKEGRMVMSRKDGRKTGRKDG